MAFVGLSDVSSAFLEGFRFHEGLILKKKRLPPAPLRPCVYRLFCQFVDVLFGK